MSPQLERIIESINKLSASEQLVVVNHISARLKKDRATETQLRWLDLVGTVPYPMLGEDAQEWVSGSRQDDQKYRDQSLKVNTLFFSP